MVRVVTEKREKGRPNDLIEKKERKRFATHNHNWSDVADELLLAIHADDDGDEWMNGLAHVMRRTGWIHIVIVVISSLVSLSFRSVRQSTSHSVISLELLEVITSDLDHIPLMLWLVPQTLEELGSFGVSSLETMI